MAKSRKSARKQRPQQEQAKLPGTIRYRPPSGRASDRALNRLKNKRMNGSAHHNGRAGQ
jgi:hypothetical protein